MEMGQLKGQLHPVLSCSTNPVQNDMKNVCGVITVWNHLLTFVMKASSPSLKLNLKIYNNKDKNTLLILRKKVHKTNTTILFTPSLVTTFYLIN